MDIKQLLIRGLGKANDRGAKESSEFGQSLKSLDIDLNLSSAELRPGSEARIRQLSSMAIDAGTQGLLPAQTEIDAEPGELSDDDQNRESARGKPTEAADKIIKLSKKDRRIQDVIKRDASYAEPNEAA